MEVIGMVELQFPLNSASIFTDNFTENTIFIANLQKHGIQTYLLYKLHTCIHK